MASLKLDSRIVLSFRGNSGGRVAILQDMYKGELFVEVSSCSVQ